MKLLKYALVFTGIFFIGIMFNMYRFGYGFDDAFWRTLMTPFTGTVWSERFTEEGFNNIKISMSTDEVLKHLGKPLQNECGKERCFWIYSYQDTPTADFDQRWIIFNKNDRVVEIRKSFFID